MSASATAAVPSAREAGRPAPQDHPAWEGAPGEERPSPRRGPAARDAGPCRPRPFGEMPCGEDWLSHPLGIVQGFFGEWRRWAPTARAGEFAEPGARPHAGLPRGLAPPRRPGGPAQRAPRHPGPAAGASHLPDSGFASSRGYAAGGGRDCRPRSLGWHHWGPEPRMQPSSDRSSDLREAPQRWGEGKALCLWEACRIFQNFRCVGGVLARGRSWL